MVLRYHNACVMINTTGNNNARVIVFPRWPIYCFVDHRNQNVIREWLRDEKVQKAQIATFQAKIDLYERSGPDLTPGFISDGPVAKHIYKIKIKGHKGHVQLRPMACYGPHKNKDNEITILFGAIEKDSKLVPQNCKEKAQENREVLIADETRRRREQLA
jgi:hypothetical protein